MITYYRVAETNPSILVKQIFNTKTDTSEEQNFKPSKTLEQNKSYTIEELISRMIIYSDNLAYDLLFENIDNDLLIKTYSDLDIDISKGFTDPGGNIVSVKDYASFFRVLFNSSYLNRTMSEKALKLLSQTDFNQALRSNIPLSIEISHKFGERIYLKTGEKQLHDCGVIYLPKKPYLLCVMTRGQDFTNLAATIRLISQKVFSTLDSTN